MQKADVCDSDTGERSEPKFLSAKTCDISAETQHFRNFKAYLPTLALPQL